MAQQSPPFVSAGSPAYWMADGTIRIEDPNGNVGHGQVVGCNGMLLDVLVESIETPDDEK